VVFEGVDASLFLFVRIQIISIVTKFFRR